MILFTMLDVLKKVVTMTMSTKQQDTFLKRVIDFSTKDENPHIFEKKTLLSTVQKF